MNAALQKTIFHLTGKASLSQVSKEELDALLQKYPYFAPLQVLYAAKLNTIDTHQANLQLQKTGLFCTNQKWLQYQLMDISNFFVKNEVVSAVSKIEIPTIEAVREMMDGVQKQELVVAAVVPEEIKVPDVEVETITAKPVETPLEVLSTEKVEIQPEPTPIEKVEVIEIQPEPKPIEKIELQVEPTSIEKVEVIEIQPEPKPIEKVELQIEPTPIERVEVIEIQPEPKPIETVQVIETPPVSEVFETNVPVYTLEKPLIIESEVETVLEILPEPSMPNTFILSTEAPTLERQNIEEIHLVEPALISQPLAIKPVEVEQEKHVNEAELPSNNTVEEVVKENIATKIFTVKQPVQQQQSLKENEGQEIEYSEDNTDSTLPLLDIHAQIAKLKVDWQKPVPIEEKFSFETEPYYTIDYFASQGIKFDLSAEPRDILTTKMLRFTDWLKKMRKVEETSISEEDEEENRDIELAISNIANVSNQPREIVTETMAQVFEKQGKINKAVQLYIKLSFLNPNKTAYFATKIQELKGITS